MYVYIYSPLLCLACNQHQQYSRQALDAYTNVATLHNCFAVRLAPVSSGKFGCHVTNYITPLCVLKNLFGYSMHPIIACTPFYLLLRVETLLFTTTYVVVVPVIKTSARLTPTHRSQEDGILVLGAVLGGTVSSMIENLYFVAQHSQFLVTQPSSLIETQSESLERTLSDLPG